MLITLKLRSKFYDFIACAIFIVVFIIAYRDILFLNVPFMGINFIVPPANMDYYLVGLFSNWFPGSLGFPSQPALPSALYFIFAIITGNNPILISKLLLCYIPIAAISMYFFLSNHFGVSRPARFVAAMLFAFSPSVVFDFTDILLWGYATLPLVFNYMLNLLNDKKARILDIMLFSMTLAFIIEFLSMILPILTLTFIIFIIMHLISAKEKVKYFITVIKRFAPSIALFVILSFQLVRGIIVYLLGGGGLVTYQNPVFYYSREDFINTFRIIGGDHLSMVYQYHNIAGFILPILAFTPLLLIRRRKPSLNIIAMSLTVLSILWLAYSIKEYLPWVAWLNEHTSLLYPMIAPQRILYLVSFSYSCMIAVTTHEAIRLAQAIKPSTLRLIPKYHLQQAKSVDTVSPITSKKDNRFKVIKKEMIVIVLLSLILLVNFYYSPYFDTYTQRSLYYPLPSSYYEILSWLSSNAPNNNYRVLIVPVLEDFPQGLNYFGGGSIGIGQTISTPYINFIYNAFVQGQTQNLGSLLAYSGVKYIIVNLEPPDLGHYVDLITRYSRTGPIRIESGTLLGNASNYIKFLDKQIDLERILTGKNFIVYLNKVSNPLLAVYPNSLFILGSMDSLNTLVMMPNFNVSSMLPILGYQNIANAQQLIKATQSIVFSNTDYNELLMLLALPKFGMNFSKIGLQQGWIVMSTNSSYFSYGDGYIMTYKPLNLTINFKTNIDSTYEVWLRVLFISDADNLKVLIDNQNLRTFKPYAPNDLGFQWVYVGSMNLNAGTHTLKLISYGFNAIDEAVIIPSTIMKEINATAMNIVNDANILFLQNTHSLMVNVTTPAGEYWIALKKPVPLLVTPEMGMINFDITDKFILTRENFKPTHDPPIFDFDNANYYFQTTKGEWVKFTFRGSGLVAIWVHTPDMEPGQQKLASQLLLPIIGVKSFPAIVNNTDIYIYMPAGSTFQPVVYSYDPEMNQNIPDKLNEITIEHFTEHDSPVLAVDGKNVTASSGSNIENGTWIQYGPFQFTAGKHKITLYQPFQAYQPIAIYNIANLSDIFSSPSMNIHYNVTKVSETKYYVSISSNKPVFLVLSQSYNPNWVASSDDQEFSHFIASFFANGFYINKTGTYTVKIEFKPTLQNIVNFVQEVAWIFVCLSLILYPVTARIIRKKTISACF